MLERTDVIWVLLPILPPSRRKNLHGTQRFRNCFAQASRNVRSLPPSRSSARPSTATTSTKSAAVAYRALGFRSKAFMQMTERSLAGAGSMPFDCFTRSAGEHRPGKDAD